MLYHYSIRVILVNHICQFVCLLSFLVVGSSALAQQNASIRGAVQTADGKPAAFVSVKLKGTSRGSIADAQGQFRIDRVKPGTYTLTASLVGLQTQEKMVTVAVGEIMTTDFTLAENNEQLQEVTITAGRTLKPDSRQLSRMPIKYLDDVQAYSVATKEVIREIGATDFQTALRAVPGAAAATTDGYGYTTLYLRGFAVSPNFRNGLFNNTLTGGDPQSIEQIEVLRGPAGTLFGSSGTAASYGGVINKVTKTAFNGQLYEGSLALGSYGLTRATADINTVLSQENNVFFRLNVAYQVDPFWQQTSAKQKDMLVAPVLVYKPSDKLQLKLEAELNSSQYPYKFYFLTDGLDLSRPRNIRDLPLRYDRYYGDQQFRNVKPVTQNFFAGQAQYTLSSGWKLTADLQKTMYDHTNGAFFPYFRSDTLMARDYYDYDYQFDATTAQLNLNGQFRLGRIQNNLLVGVNVQDVQQASQGRYSATPFHMDTINLARDFVPIANPTTARANANNVTFTYLNQFRSTGLYVADQVDLTNRFHVLLSLRYDWYYNPGYADFSRQNPQPYRQGALSPKLGAVYQLIPEKLSLFGNYSTGFNNVAPTSLQTFQPEFSRQWEGGVKLALNNILTGTLSYYDIAISNVVRQSPTNQQLRIQDGTRLSRGIDVEVVANPLPGWRILAGYGYNNSQFERADESVQGKRPAGVAPHAANLWTTYAVQTGILRGLGFGFGFNHYAQNFNNDLNTFVIPAYTVLNATVFYNVGNCRFSLNGNNLTNQRYWNYAGLPQKPINWLASLSVRI
ncbi:TonB-dependent receptor [Fibrisoma montanum]|uniref:TonB-dependent receptor n=1 Tax=Fibrisoma montanum TaxID=2305895 RepID=A0A418M0L5_9BACT|nr:TonB-dependent receptor [Fibrisoma montanum]RIV19039.1 TonB-dependent receptor [Fibrisoma montanum]